MKLFLQTSMHNCYTLLLLQVEERTLSYQMLNSGVINLSHRQQLYCNFQRGLSQTAQSDGQYGLESGCNLRVTTLLTG